MKKRSDVGIKIAIVVIFILCGILVWFIGKGNSSETAKTAEYPYLNKTNLEARFAFDSSLGKFKKLDADEFPENYYEYTGENIEIADVSRTEGTSWNPDFELDSKGYPHVVWHDASGPGVQVYYIRWNGEDWVCVNGSVYTPGESYPKMRHANPAIVSKTDYYSQEPSLALDSNDNPHITWQIKSKSDFEGELIEDIYFVKWDDSNWVCADGSKYDPSNIDLSNPVNVSRSFSRSEFSEIELDSNGNPHIIWEEHSKSSNIHYVRWDGENWICSDGSVYDPMNPSKRSMINISEYKNLVDDSTLLIDKNDKLHLVFSGSVGGELQILYLTHNDEGWVSIDGKRYLENKDSSNISKGGNESAYHPSMTLDKNGNPHIAWSWGSFEISYIKWNDENWVCADDSIYDPKNLNIKNPANVSKNKGNSLSNDISLDSNGYPYIVWHDYGFERKGKDSEVMMVKWDGSEWVSIDGSEYDPIDESFENPAIISKHSDLSEDPIIIVDEKDTPHVMWCNGGKELPYIKWNGKNWEYLR